MYIMMCSTDTLWCKNSVYYQNFHHAAFDIAAHIRVGFTNWNFSSNLGRLAKSFGTTDVCSDRLVHRALAVWHYGSITHNKSLGFIIIILETLGHTSVQTYINQYVHHKFITK